MRSAFELDIVVKRKACSSLCLPLCFLLLSIESQNKMLATNLHVYVLAPLADLPELRYHIAARNFSVVFHELCDTKMSDPFLFFVQLLLWQSTVAGARKPATTTSRHLKIARGLACASLLMDGELHDTGPSIVSGEPWHHGSIGTETSSDCPYINGRIYRPNYTGLGDTRHKGTSNVGQKFYHHSQDNSFTLLEGVARPKVFAVFAKEAV